MKIQGCNTPYFGAKFINNTYIGKKSDNSTVYSDHAVSFVEIEPDNKNDIEALKNIAKYWKDDKFALNTYYAACELRDNNKHYKGNKVYALTTQEKNFKNLSYENILGVIHTSDFSDKSLFIEHLQVNPDYIYKDNPPYRGIGTGILNSLKKLSNRILCFPSSAKSVLDFYDRNGFFEYPPQSNLYTWYRDIFERF